MPEMMNKDRQRFAELLAFHVNGTLGTEDQAWMDAYIAAHPETQAEHRFVELLRDISRATASAVPEPQRLKRFMQDWREARPAVSPLQRLRMLLSAPLRIPSAAVAVVAVLVIGQSTLIGLMMTADSSQETFRGEPAECIVMPRLRVVFNPEASHMEVILLLRKLEATLSDGPTETGEFWLKIPRGRSLEEAQGMLRSSSVVDEAIVSQNGYRPANCNK